MLLRWLWLTIQREAFHVFKLVPDYKALKFLLRALYAVHMLARHELKWAKQVVWTYRFRSTKYTLRIGIATAYDTDKTTTRVIRVLTARVSRVGRPAYRSFVATRSMNKRLLVIVCFLFSVKSHVVILFWLKLVSIRCALIINIRRSV